MDVSYIIVCYSGGVKVAQPDCLTLLLLRVSVINDETRCHVQFDIIKLRMMSMGHCPGLDFIILLNVTERQISIHVTLSLTVL